MKKIINITLAAVMLSLTACTDCSMNGISVNNANPAEEKVYARLQITDVIMSTAMSAVSGDYSFYTSVINEQSVGTGNNQFMKAELRNAAELAAPTTFDNSWKSVYANLENCKQMIDKVDNDIAISGGQLDVKGAAQVMYVINYQILTDMHGAIPFKDALKGLGNMQPSVQSQKEVYSSLMEIIDDAINNLNTAYEEGMENFGKEDILFKGDVEKWLALAYAEKARLWIHQTKVNPNAAQEALDAAETALGYGFEGAVVNEFDGGNTVNPWAAFLDSRGYNTPSATVARLMAPYKVVTTDNGTSETEEEIFVTMAELNEFAMGLDEELAAETLETLDKEEFEDESDIQDFLTAYDAKQLATDPSYNMTTTVVKRPEDPRLAHYITLNAPDGYFEGYYGYAPGFYAVPGDASYAKESWSWNISEWYYMYDEPVNIFPLYELYFIKAEAEKRTDNDEATASFQTAVELSVNDIDAICYEGSEPGADYAADLVAELGGTVSLKDIFQQKYIAMCNDGQVETYTDIRRCMAEGNEYVEMTNPYNTQSGFNRWPYSLPYAESSVSTNPAIKAIAGDGSYIYTKKLWLFGGEE